MASTIRGLPWTLSRVSLIVGGLMAYALVFELTYPMVGGIAGALNTPVVATAGWLMGRWVGLLTAVLSILLNTLLFYQVGIPGWADVLGRWPGILVNVSIGVGVGWVSELFHYAQEQTRKLTQERAALVEQITERQRAEQALLDEKQRVQLLYELSHSLITMLSPREVASRALEQLCTTFQAVSGYVYIVQPGTDRLTCLASLGVAPLTSDERPHPIQLYLGQGVVGWVAVTQQATIIADVRQDSRWIVVPGLDEEIRSTVCLPLILGDELLGTLNLNSDRLDAFHANQLPLLTAAIIPIATALKTTRSVEALRESEARYHGLVDEIPVGLYRTTPAGQFLEVNPALVQMVRFPDKETLMAANVIEGYVNPEERQQWQARIEREGVISHFEFQVRRYDGTVIWVRDSARVLRDAEGRVRYYDGILEDITERKHLEMQLRQSQKMDAIGQLAGGVAHDFNNLLTVILGYSDSLMYSLDPHGPLYGYAREIKQAGERAVALVRQLMAFSRRQLLQPQVLDLNTIVANLEKMLRRLLKEDIDLVTVLAPTVGRVSMDAGQLEQVIVNLAVNARDAMPQGGTLTIETANVELDAGYARTHPGARPGAYVGLTLRDTGIGMDQETLAHIFEPFFTTKEPGQGTGLGLATVYGIVKQSNGYIQVDSAPGQGTAFTIYLPRVEDTVEEREPSPAVTGLPTGTETLLLVEDEQNVRGLTRRVLQAAGYTVLTAANGEEALRLCEPHVGPIHLLVTDVVMPQMSGPILAERLTARYPAVKVLYMSGYTDDAIIRHRIVEAGLAFLQKPFTPDVLARKVREVLDA